MKILLVEDDHYTSEMLSATLLSNHYIVDAIADGAMGFEMATHWDYDLILLDILLPSLNGIEICHKLRAQNCLTPILILTAKDSNEDVIAGLDAGADDYVAKSCEPSQLLARVRALLRRGGNSSSPILRWGALCLDPAAARVTYHNQALALRPKEYNLLELFLRNPQRILNRNIIIDHLWTYEETPVEGSVTNLIKDLRRRLKSAGMEEDFIETVYGLGYRLNTAPAVSENTDLDESNAELNGDRPHNQALRNQRGQMVIQEATERFRVSLEQRIADLETAGRSLQTGTLSPEQRKATSKEVHKLAGGLGTFGYGKASEVAKEIEQLFDPQSVLKEKDVAQLTRLLEDLKRAIAEPLTQSRCS